MTAVPSPPSGAIAEHSREGALVTWRTPGTPYLAAHLIAVRGDRPPQVVITTGPAHLPCADREPGDVRARAFLLLGAARWLDRARAEAGHRPPPPEPDPQLSIYDALTGAVAL